MRRVAVIGPGRMGTLLAVACSRAGYRVVAAGGGGEEARARLSHLLPGIRGHADPADAAGDADLVLLAVPDDRLTEVVTRMAVADVLDEHHRVVHVAGSRGLDVLDRAARAGAGVAACHPAMTVPAGSTDPQLLVGTAWAVTAPVHDRGWAHELVRDLGGDPHDVAEEARGRYHAALTVGSNAAGAAVAVARLLLRSAQVDDVAAFLGPLVEASVRNVVAHGASALTGPVVRGDAGTVARHLGDIDADLPELGRAYRHLSAVVLELVRPQLDAEVAAQLASLLGE